MANALNMNELIGTSYYFLKQYFGKDVKNADYNDFLLEGLRQKLNEKREEKGITIEEKVEEIMGTQSVGSMVLENKKGDEVAEMNFTELPTLFNNMTTSSVGLEIVPGKVVENMDMKAKEELNMKIRTVEEKKLKTEQDKKNTELDKKNTELDKKNTEEENIKTDQEDTETNVEAEKIEKEKAAAEEEEAKDKEITIFIDKIQSTLKQQEKQEQQLKAEQSDIKIKKLTLDARIPSSVFSFLPFSQNPEQKLQEGLIAAALSKFDNIQNQPPINEEMKKTYIDNIKNTLINLQNNKKLIEEMNTKFTNVSSQPEDREKQITQFTEIKDSLKNIIDNNKIDVSLQDIEDIKTKNKENMDAYGKIMAKVILKLIELDEKQKKLKSEKEQEEAMKNKSKIEIQNDMEKLDKTITAKKTEINQTIEEINKQIIDSKYKYVNGDTLENISSKIEQFNKIIQKLTTESNQLESSYNDIKTQLITLGKNNDDAYKKEKGIDNIDPAIEKVKLSIQEAESYNNELKLQKSKIEGFDNNYKEISTKIDSLQENINTINTKINTIKTSSEDNDITKVNQIKNEFETLTKRTTDITNLYNTIKTMSEIYPKFNDGIKDMENKSKAAETLVEEVRDYLNKLGENNKPQTTEKKLTL
jgi:chromosome segregation ATPase